MEDIYSKINEDNCKDIIAYIRKNFLEQCKGLFSNQYKYKTDPEYRRTYIEKVKANYHKNKDLKKNNMKEYYNKKVVDKLNILN